MALQTELDEETFGDKLTSARGKKRLGLREVAERVSRYVPISMSTLSRLEGLNDPPLRRRQRSIAALYALELGYDPSAFGLSIEDLPPGIREVAVRSRCCSAAA